jgi:hypothetical protein
MLCQSLISQIRALCSLTWDFGTSALYLSNTVSMTSSGCSWRDVSPWEWNSAAQQQQQQ